MEKRLNLGILEHNTKYPQLLVDLEKNESGVTIVIYDSVGVAVNIATINECGELELHEIDKGWADGHGIEVSPRGTILTID